MKAPVPRSALLPLFGLLLLPPGFLHASDLPAVPDGDYPTWHLPEGAVIRLGKGRMGESDRAVSFSPDGRLLAVASGIGVWLYDVENPGRLTLLPVELVNAVSFSPDGTILASGSLPRSLSPGFGGKITLWDVASGSRTATFADPVGAKQVAFSPDGRSLAYVGSAGQVGLWDVVTGTLIHNFPTTWNLSVAFSPDGITLASGAEDETARLWDLRSRSNTATFTGHGGYVESLSFSPDSTTLASASGDGNIRLWDVASGRNTAVLEHRGQVTCVSFSPDGSTLVSGAWHRTVRLWDMETKRNITTLPRHGGSVVAVSFSPDNSIVASASEDGKVNLWDLQSETATTLSGHKSAIWAMAFSPDGNLLASKHGPERAVHLWDTATGRKIATLSGQTLPVLAISISPDAATLASGSQDGTVLLWDLETRNTITTLVHSHMVTSVSFSPDGGILASGDVTGGVFLWDVKTGEEIATLSGLGDVVTSLSFSPDGTTLAAGSNNGDIRLWDMATGTAAASLPGHSRRVFALSFSPDGETLFSGSGTHRITWDVVTETPLAIALEDWIDIMAFSPDGTLFATGTQDNLVKLWDMETGTTIAPLEGHAHHVINVLFSPDGRTLASGSHDGTILLWDVQLLLPHPRTVTKSSGDKQQAAAGTQLGEPFVVSVLDQNGNPFPGATVTFSVTAGGGFLSAAAVITDANGQAATTLTLGSDPGRNTAAARVGELKPVIFGATGLAVATIMVHVSGDEQEGPAGAALAEPFVVEVRDQNNNPLEGAEVTFAVTDGGGTLSATTATTDAEGRAVTTLTLGSEPGGNTVLARTPKLLPVTFDAVGVAVPQSLTRSSGNRQQGGLGAALAEPFAVSVLDQNGNPLPGAEVTFSVTAGGGSLSATTATTDAEGRAVTTLTLGSEPETVTVVAAVAGLDPVTFTATAKATPDFDGDGETSFSDFFLFADAFGGSDPRFDLDESGTVDFLDFFLFADYFSEEAQGKLLVFAREMIGLPDGPQLQQNAPNPFNSETVISWFQLRPGAARVEVFALTGQRVAVLHRGPKKGGVHRVHWDGRDDRGLPLASGVYLYRLATDETVQTRKLTLLR